MRGLEVVRYEKSTVGGYEYELWLNASEYRTVGRRSLDRCEWQRQCRQAHVHVHVRVSVARRVKP